MRERDDKDRLADDSIYETIRIPPDFSVAVHLITQRRGFGMAGNEHQGLFSVGLKSQCDPGAALVVPPKRRHIFLHGVGVDRYAVPAVYPAASPRARRLASSHDTHATSPRSMSADR